MWSKDEESIMQRIQIPRKRNVTLGVGFKKLKEGCVNIYYKNEYLGTGELISCTPSEIYVSVESIGPNQVTRFHISGIPIDCTTLNKKYDAELFARKVGVDDKEFGDNHKSFFKWLERKVDISKPTKCWIYRWRWKKMKKELPKPKIPVKIGPRRCKCGRWEKELIDEISFYRFKGAPAWNIEVRRTGGLTFLELEGLYNKLRKALAKKGGK